MAYRKLVLTAVVFLVTPLHAATKPTPSIYGSWTGTQYTSKTSYPADGSAAVVTQTEKPLAITISKAGRFARIRYVGVTPPVVIKLPARSLRRASISGESYGNCDSELSIRVELLSKNGLYYTHRTANYDCLNGDDSETLAVSELTRTTARTR